MPQLVGLVGDLVKNRLNGASDAGVKAAVGVIEDAARSAIRMENNPLEVVEKILPLLHNNGGGNAELIRLMMEQSQKNVDLVLRVIEANRAAPAAASGSLAEKIDEFTKLEKLPGRNVSRRRIGLGVGTGRGSAVARSCALEMC